MSNPAVVSVGCGLSDEGTGDYDFTILRPTEPMIRTAFNVCYSVVQRVADAFPLLKVVKARFYHTRYHARPTPTPDDLPGVITLEITVVWAEESKDEIEAQIGHDCEFPDNWLLKPGKVTPSEFTNFVETSVELVLKAVRKTAREKQAVLSGRSEAIRRAVNRIV